MSQKFPKLSSSFDELENFYDVIIVGSGYGASIAASRCARAGQLVCVLEKGKEWLPGSFPETSATAFKNMQISKNGNPNIIGKANGLYDIVISKDITVLKGCGLGGTSLINANVVLDADENVFNSKHWPKEIRDDMKDLKEVDRKHVFEMLQPTKYPDEYPVLKKVGAMEKAARSLFPDIEELGIHFQKTPLAVNFQSEKTEERKYRFDQPACNGCGNCCGGCNTGAKQTLNMNYLPDAKCYGAKIFTEVAVSSVLRDEHGYLWKVQCHLNVDSKGLKRKEITLRAHNVIIGAGSLGSTQILLKSKTDGLEISNTIGSRFTGNGDALGFCYDSSMEMNAIGCATGKYDKVKSTSPGPCITTVIDLRHKKRKVDNSESKGDTEKGCKVNGSVKRESAINENPFKGDIIIEDGTPPGALSKLLKVALFVDSEKCGKHVFPKPAEFEKICKTLLASDKLDKTLPFLCMGHDDSSGEIRIGDNGDGVYIDWENVGRQEVFENMAAKMRAITKELGGTFIQNPIWSDMMDKKVVTVHPLGGCPMGSNGREGVVNHKGEVFIGNSNSVYRGLYVMDGSIIPSPVGVNPLLTISMLAERCCRLMCEKNNWKIDYDEVKDFNNMELPQCKPGLRFTEKMSGSLNVKATSKDVDCQFVVSITADDVENFLNEAKHGASVFGTVECPLLSNGAVTISNGTFNLFRENETKSEAKVLMEYNFNLTTTDGISYRFKGIKKRVKGGVGLYDSTTLYTELYEGGENGMLIAEGILKIHVKDFMKQLRTIDVINTQSEILKIKWTSAFGKYFFGGLWFSHGKCVASMYKDSPEAGRMKRDLDIKNVTPQVFSFDTEDQVPLMLTRYQGGTKGPLIACHGLGTNSSLFNLTTVQRNFVEYFVSNEYDVWLLDSRHSTFCPWASQSKEYSLDDLANFDFPAAVDVVLKHTKREKLQMFVHCAGALPFWGSLLSGKLNGKIASIIVSQVSPITKGSMGNIWKSWLHLTEIPSNLGINLVDPNSEILIYKSSFEWFKSFLTSWMLSLPSTIAGKIAEHLFPRNDNICTNGVCHRVSELYGRLYEHQNLTRETHDTLYELFGIGALGHFNHLSKCFRAGKLVDKEGNDIYLPGVDKHGKLDESAHSKDWVKNLNVPILMFCGEKNKVFQPHGMQTMERVLKELHPEQDYRLILLEEYGHIDGIIGKYAVSDLWPELLPFLDTHSQSSSANDENVAKKVAQTMHQLELIGNTADLSEALREAICHDSTDFSFKGAHNKDDVLIEEIPFYEQRLKGVLPNQDEYVWERKVEIHTRFEKHREYKPEEKVETYFISEESKRTIYVLSDVHMGSSWTKDSVSELRQFESYLKGIALSTAHSIVLLGDVFDLWATPIDQRPISLDEMKRQWMQKPTFFQVLDSFKKMAENSDVNIFYVKGNHDHEMTEQVVKELLGDHVIFIPDKLILHIKTNGQPYFMRFEHGHAYDIFNTYELTNDTLKGKPIGYYVSRCAQSNNTVDAPGLLRKILYKFLSSSIGKTLGSEVVDLMARWPSLQHCLLKTIFKAALGKSIAKDTGVVMEDGSKVLINDIVKYPLITEAKKKYGSSEAYLMLLAAAAGNYEEFLARMPEDVIVFGHTHEFKNQKSSSKSNAFHYANSGSWTDIAKCKSYICLTLPTKEQNGQVSCRFACSVDGSCSDSCMCAGNHQNL